MNSRKSARITLTLVLALVAGGSLLPAVATGSSTLEDEATHRTGKSRRLPVVPPIPGRSAAATNDAFADAIALDLPPASVDGSNIAATLEPGEPVPCGDIAATVWYRLDVSQAASLAANTFEADYDTVLAVYEGTSMADLALLDCNDDMIGLRSEVFFEVDPGGTYYLQVGGFYGEQGMFRLAVGEEGVSPGAALSGSIVGEDGGVPSVACITLYDETGAWADQGYMESVTGSYRLRHLEPGTYYIEFRACGEYPRYLPQWYDGAPDMGSGTPVTLQEGSETSGIDAVLPLGGTISGTVSDEGGAPVDACLSASSTEPGSWLSRYADSDPTTGDFSIEGLPTGEYKVWISDCIPPREFVPQYYDRAASWEEADPIAVTAGTATSGLAVVMEPGGSITGRVTDARTGEPVANVCARTVDADGRSITDESHEDGVYRVGGLPPGDYVVSFEDCWGAGYRYQYYDGQRWFDDADPVTVVDRVETTGIDASLLPVGLISGRVTRPNGQPIHACIGLHAPDGTLVDEVSRVDGSYWFEAEIGTYAIRFRDCGGTGFATEWYDDRPDLASADLVVVEQGVHLRDIDAVLDGPASIAGRVTRATGSGMRDACVRLEQDGTVVSSTLTDGSGGYRFSDLIPGAYQVHFRPCGFFDTFAFAPEYFADRHGSEAPDPVVVSPSTETRADAQLERWGGMSGRVTDEQGSDLEGICVELHSPQGDVVATAMTQEDGDWLITQLLAGEYRVRFRKCSGSGILTEWFDDAPDLASSDPVLVEWGQTTAGVNAALRRADLVFSIGLPTVHEGGEGAAYTVSLSGAPSGEVTVGLDPGDQLTVEPSTLIFTPDDWNVPRDVAVEAVDDFVTEGEHWTAVRHTANGGGFTGTVREKQVRIRELWARLFGAVTTADGPAANVCVSAHDDAGEMLAEAITTSSGTYSMGSLRAGEYRIRFRDCGGGFLHTEWYDDRPDLASADVISLELDEARPANATLLGPGIDFEATDGSTRVTEAGEGDTYSVRLRTAPSESVTVAIDPGVELSVFPSSIVFTPDDWAVPQTVSVEAVDNGVIENERVRGAAIQHEASGDPAYDGRRKSLSVGIEDDDWLPELVYTGEAGSVRGSEITVGAVLQRRDGSPLPSQEVDFFFYGERYEAETDQDGEAEVTFTNMGQYGSNEIDIWFLGSEQLQLPWADTTATIEALWEHRFVDGENELQVNTITNELRFVAPGDTSGVHQNVPMTDEELPTGERHIRIVYPSDQLRVVGEFLPDRGTFAAVAATETNAYVLRGVG